MQLDNKRIARRHVARNSKEILIKRKEWIEKWTQTGMDYLSNCVFVDVFAFNINMRPSKARSATGTLAIVTTTTTRAVSHTILRTVCAMGLVNIVIRLSNLSKRKFSVFIKNPI
jgi:hypothetical protein